MNINVRIRAMATGKWCVRTVDANRLSNEDVGSLVEEMLSDYRVIRVEITLWEVKP